ncbi:MAG TPA: 50S ribosomal protein L17 [Bacteroidota bacterium]|nr:50S ribosomal protein L17 [Bacteroidota bacterium]
MIHGRSGRKLKRTTSHRKALLSALSTSLLRHKKIRTTLAKAKETRMVVEKIITRAKRAVAKEVGGAPKDVHARREVARFIHDKDVVKMLFGEIATKVENRPGGYTRVVKLGRRFGDAADIAVLELVDYNTGKDETKPAVKPKRARRGPRKKNESAESAPAEQAAAETSAAPEPSAAPSS